MKKFRFISAMMVCVAAMFLSTACASVDKADEMSQGNPVTVVVSQDFPHYKSIDSLAERADAIIKGKVVNTRVEAINDRVISESTNEELNPGGNPPVEKNIYTIYTIEIEEAYKGNYKPGDTLDFKELGGTVGNTTFVAEEKVDISNEYDYIFFLATYDNTPASLLNSIQSLYIYGSVNESGVNSKKAAPATLTSAHPENDLILNLDDLKEIKNKYK